jgi:hypothetical protein
MAFVVIYDACVLYPAPLRDLVEALSRTRGLMIRAIPDCLVTGYEGLIDGLDLPDPDDRHVLAAAIRASAQAIITFNLKDFPDNALAPYNIEAKHPDDFVLETIDLAPGAVTRVITEQCADLKDPPGTIASVLDTLRGQGLVQSVARLRELFAIPAI